MRDVKQARELSAGPFRVGSDDQDKWFREDVNLGSLQRIADACELMAKNHADLVVERDVAVAVAEERLVVIERRDRQIAALRGQITKLKKRLEAPHAD